ncbi:formylglycine-generating enzyme family protein [Chitinophaga nivalis]|uniref:Formylglycine-generating enzyme family protein n=1 Tax=Chitinophaga nivalis TaxID=2991709 RepID=A0ABT3IVE4_9BACT|nr:formylglycine-generating enzyme family protein [Chitinophaga nivalis]MCW3462356.1 formylglycine-generating enzyme family protein [Chitinophaga nivalis]MCW3487953.1 formylglycine-generating enzyme family protein [Chitinophaga nivalis]
MTRQYMTLLLGLICSQGVVAQSQAFEPYEQKLPGTALSFKMVPIKGGSFTLGSPDNEKGRNKDEGPAAAVQLSDFWMGATEVTFDEYDVYADAEKDKTPIPDGMTRPSPPYIDLTLGMGKSGGYPANSMSQYGALMYCRWLYAKTGVFYRLPTAAEWEYACRAGATTAYPFGNDAAALKDYAWFKENSDQKYHKVAQLKPNAWGLYDMLGNVAEWTMDQYEETGVAQASGKDPWIHPTAKTPRVVKGGNYQDAAPQLRSAARLKSDPVWNRRDPQIPKSFWWNADAPFVGFRIVRPVQQPTAIEAAQFFEEMIDKYKGAR